MISAPRGILVSRVGPMTAIVPFRTITVRCVSIESLSMDATFTSTNATTAVGSVGKERERECLVGLLNASPGATALHKRVSKRADKIRLATIPPRNYNILYCTKYLTRVSE